MKPLLGHAAFWIAAAVLTPLHEPAQGQEFLSHPPMRPLPEVSPRRPAAAHEWYVDSQVGNDSNSGTRESPWRTIQHAVAQLKPGDVLSLRGGTYYEHVTVTARGTAEQSITIRSLPGELAVIDGGLREFFEHPAKAWEPAPGGAVGEFHSVQKYPDLGDREGATLVLGNFGDSMIPLHGYRYITDLRAANEYFDRLNAGKTESGEGVYCGPGVFYDVNSQRIHVRLAHTHQRALGTDNYRGETDPRKLPLVIAGLNAGSALSIDGAHNLRVQDIAVRGARAATIAVMKCINVEFDGVTAYGGSAAMEVRDTAGLRIWNCALRGIAAPWTYRGSLKYRAIEARIFSASGWNPTGNDNRDFELAYSEFTDCVDGVFFGNVKNVRFHHNLLENVSDDGIFLTSTTGYDGTTPGGNVHIFQNRLSRCLTTFAFGVGHGRQKMTPRGRQTGSGVFIYRNIFDFRRPVMYTQPPEQETQITSYGRVAGDHGGPLWEPMTIYHNTLLQGDSPFRGYYLAGLGGHMSGGSKRRLFNNIVVHANGGPGNVMPPVVPPGPAKAGVSKIPPETPADPLAKLLDGDVEAQPKASRSAETADSELSALNPNEVQNPEPVQPLPIDFQADGNVHWSYAEPQTAEALFSRFRESSDFTTSKKLYPPGWTANDLVADPQFAAFNANWSAAVDLRLKAGSPAHGSAVEIPVQWPDPLRVTDRSRPDAGAIPAGAQPWRVGMRGRLTVSGQVVNPPPSAIPAPAEFLLPADQTPAPNRSSGAPIIVVEGYPAFDAPLIHYVLNRHAVPFQSLQRTWLKPIDYSKYRAVVIAGSLARAGIVPNRYDAEDLPHIRQYLEGGGKLVLMRGNTAVFDSEEGAAYLSQLTGGRRGNNSGEFEILQPDHSWLKHLDRQRVPSWINLRQMQPLRATRGDIIIGNRSGLATLYRVSVGKGELIYVGWDVAASIPHGRSVSTVEQEDIFEQQMRVLSNVIDSLAGIATPQ